jgi:hypothetical protein
MFIGVGIFVWCLPIRRIYCCLEGGVNDFLLVFPFEARFFVLWLLLVSECIHIGMCRETEKVPWPSECIVCLTIHICVIAFLINCCIV